MILKACVFREVVAGSLGQEAWTAVMVLPQHGCAVSSKLLHFSGPPCSHQTVILHLDATGKSGFTNTRVNIILDIKP